MSIPKPLVQLNQLFIVITVLIALLAAKWLLLLPFLVGVVTLATKRNTVIMAGKKLLKKPASSYQMEDRDQQLFNQWIATICMGVAFISFLMGYTLVGYVFSIMVILAAGVALMGYCIGCTIRYRYMMWKYKRKKHAA
jgi:amino acid transporter